MTPRRWQIWRIWFAYDEDPTRGKYRPVVIKDVTGDGCVVVYVTSRVHGHAPDLIPIRNWAEAGLPKASAIRYRRQLRIRIDQLGDYVGDLSPYDRIELQMKYL